MIQPRSSFLCGLNRFPPPMATPNVLSGANAVKSSEQPIDEGPDRTKDGQLIFKTKHYREIPVTERGAIRILRIQAGSPDQKDVICELVPSTIAEQQTGPGHVSAWTASPRAEDETDDDANTLEFIPYDALSWCWGKLPSDAEIKIKKGRQQYVKHVQPGLVAALRALRHRTHDVDLWVDAICINQVDTAEKNVSEI